MEHNRRADEEAKQHYLKKQASQDDILSQLPLRATMGLGLDTAASADDEKGKDVPGHEDLGKPLQRNDRMRLCVQRAYRPPKGHVDGSGEQGGSNEDEDRLHDVRVQGLRVGVVDHTAYVADCLDYREDVCQ